ncbi:DegT/DnrJ/EryC1/StrS family aminotransferase [Halosimplex salinum]|uniref:DegT/DnrJ/EryC1/StrS family aminotransferase n=1 Tax=Halosimplex salinum TaxID=1710538 RepID=UPI000F4A2C89|nr:DegT/DnrJ/EryC1/StrS family aminotransferase [Halosimplex salinum]
MIPERPSPIRWLLPSGSVGVESLFDRHAAYRFYGYGKGALGDALAPFVGRGETALLPAYLPDAVAEPFADVGFDAEYYAVTDRLRPDFDDLADRCDEGTGVIVAVNYFGFPTGDHSRVGRLAERHDCLHVDNSSHSAFSVVDGELLGSRGDVGFASLRKFLPIPDGAVLFFDDALADAVVPSGHAGRREGFTGDDVQYLVSSAVRDALHRREGLRRPVERAVSAGSGSVASPRERYEASKVPMSRLSSAVVARTDPTAVRAQRRENYLAWDRGLADRPGLEPVFDELPPGVCPQVYPVRATVPRRFLGALRDAGVVGADTWPRLPTSVSAAPEYASARRLADELITLPVHQQVGPADVEDVCRRLDR